MKKSRIALVVVIAVLVYNAYDFIKALNNKETENLDRCVKTFIKNTKSSNPVAEKYCKCAIRSLEERYEGSNANKSEIIAKERMVLEDCYNNAVLAVKNKAD
jgi:hypothetical protein